MPSILKLLNLGASLRSAPDGDRSSARELVDQGIAAESAGDPAQALKFYRRAIEADARFAPAHMNLGIALHAAGDLAAAIAAHEQAIALAPSSAAAYYNLGLVRLETADAAQAEADFRAALELRIEFPQAYVGLADALEVLGRNADALAALDTATRQCDHYIGAQFNASVLLQKMGRPDAARTRLREIDLVPLLISSDRHAELESIARQMIQVWPDHAVAWRALGSVLTFQRRLEEAVPVLQQALMCVPSDLETHNNLGIVFADLGRASEAEASFRRALELKSDYCEAHNNLGNTLKGLQRFDEAQASYRRALELKPDFHQAHNNLGIVLQEIGQLAEAEASYRRALELAPDSHDAHYSLGTVLQATGRSLGAEASFRRALELEPHSHLTHNNLGVVLQTLGRSSEAEAIYRRALELKPDYHVAHGNLGVPLHALGRAAEAQASFRHALLLAPDSPVTRSNLLFALTCTDSLSRNEVFEEHLAWARRHEAPLAPLCRPHPKTRDPQRRLRVGYVSPDFRRHSVAYFLEALLARHDRDAFEVYCYANVLKPDSVTQHLLGLADRAHNILGMSDTRAAELVRSDAIDILVDLAGHSEKNRLGLFGLKPAPLQVTYLGYPNTTGLTAIDWRLTDIHADPPGDGDQFHSERLMRLAQTFLCYRPPQDAPAVQPPPYFRNGHITFGSFNALPKVTPQVIRTWACLLKRVPGSRLMLKALGLRDASGCERLRGEFAQHGVGRDRLTLLAMDDDFRAHLARYHDIDIGLDPFPYNGTTTTLEALWMGVPVVNLAGDRHAARVGDSILANLGLDTLIARSVDEYLAIAAGLAADGVRMAALRATMRARVAASPLRDETGFASAVEHAYRQMWLGWCSGNSAGDAGADR